MQRIHPISEDSCRPLVGRTVLLCLRDGSEFVGVLTGIENGHLVFGEEEAAAKSGKPSKTKGKGSVEKDAATDLSGFPPFGFGADGPFVPRRLTFDIAFIALLFLLTV